MAQRRAWERVWAAAIGVGIALAAVGWAAYLLNPARIGAGPPRTSLVDWSIVICPSMIAFGLVAGARSLYRGARAYSARSILITGVVMLAAGVFPWAYTPYLTGGRSGNEGAGMLGTLLFMLVGVPGLLVALLGIFLGGLTSDAA